MVKHARPLWVAGATQPPTPRTLGKGRAELRVCSTPQGLSLPLSFCQFEVLSHLLCEKLSAGPEALRCRAVLQRKGPSAWENVHPHARTCFHSEMHPGPRGRQVPRQHRDARSPLFPVAGNVCLSSVKGEVCPGETVLHLTCAPGDTHASLGREGWGQGRGAVISSILPRHRPASSGGQGSLFENTPLPGSPGGGRREEVGAQIPTEIL